MSDCPNCGDFGSLNMHSRYCCPQCGFVEAYADEPEMKLVENLAVGMNWTQKPDIDHALRHETHEVDVEPEKFDADWNG